jgi:hypothetical protein
MSLYTRCVLAAFRSFMAEARFTNNLSIADAWRVYRSIVEQHGREFARDQLLRNYA